eukprot:scaffold434_cov175-Amphora_coffeaeformis.AAC.2
MSAGYITTPLDPDLVDVLSVFPTDAAGTTFLLTLVPCDDCKSRNHGVPVALSKAIRACKREQLSCWRAMWAWSASRPSKGPIFRRRCRPGWSLIRHGEMVGIVL